MIRQATLDDIDLLVATRQIQLVHEGISPDCDIEDALYRFFRQTLSNQQLYQLLMFDDDRLIATGAVVFYDYPPTYTNASGKIAYITNMYTDPHYRQQGHATRLLHLLEEEVKRRHVEVMRLGASRLGRPVYEHFGFKQDTEWLSKRLTIINKEEL